MVTGDPAGMLREKRLRVTRPRLAVLSALTDHPHSDVETLTEITRDQLGSVSKQAVYDVLRALVDVDLVRRIEPAGSPARFEARVGDNHHHVVCRQCGDIADVDCAVGAAPCLTGSSTHAYVIDEAEVTYWGVCPQCQTDSRSAPTGSVAPVKQSSKEKLCQ